MTSKYLIAKDKTYFGKGIIIADTDASKFIKFVFDGENITILAQQLKEVEDNYKVIDFIFEENDILNDVFSKLNHSEEMKQIDNRNNIHALSVHYNEEKLILSMAQNLDLSLNYDSLPITILVDKENQYFIRFVEIYFLLRENINHEMSSSKVKTKKINRND